MKAVVEHGREILGDPGHPPGADRLDPGLLDGFEHRACLLASGHQLAVHRGVVTVGLERYGTKTARHRSLEWFGGALPDKALGFRVRCHGKGSQDLRLWLGAAL